MKENRELKTLVHLATTNKGELIYWDTETGVKEAGFKVIIGKKVANVSLSDLKTFTSTATFSSYHPNVWF